MTYESQPGTIPHRLILHLQSLPEGTELSAAESAKVLELESARGLRKACEPAVRHGALSIRIAGPRLSWYRLGDGAMQSEQEDGPFVTRVDATAVPSVFAYAAQRQAAPFSTAVSSDGRLILQRHGRVIAELTPEESRAHTDFLQRRGAWEMVDE